MGLRKLLENLNIIQALPDKPTNTATELKQQFDLSGNKIKTYINETLTEDLDSALSTINTTLSTMVTKGDSNQSLIVTDLEEWGGTDDGFWSGYLTITDLTQYGYDFVTAQVIETPANCVGSIYKIEDGKVYFNIMGKTSWSGHFQIRLIYRRIYSEV